MRPGYCSAARATVTKGMPSIFDWAIRIRSKGSFVDRREFRECKRMFAVDWQLYIAVLEKPFFQHRGIGAKIRAALRLLDHDLPQAGGTE
ncbi:hypothetical protein ATY81_00850 [Rhizobium sp. R72]|nr:hypothetical protein ATY81_00850 [Rhizobium sp. R72]OWW05630.1 hypothetical protein ATY80_00850 [Rhizobium sp. R711]